MIDFKIEEDANKDHDDGHGPTSPKLHATSYLVATEEDDDDSSRAAHPAEYR